MVACKTEKEQPETPSDTGKNEHRKKGQNRKWKWKIGHGANRKCIRGNGVGIVYPDKIWPQNKKQKREKKRRFFPLLAANMVIVADTCVARLRRGWDIENSNITLDLVSLAWAPPHLS